MSTKKHSTVDKPEVGGRSAHTWKARFIREAWARPAAIKIQSIPHEQQKMEEGRQVNAVNNSYHHLLLWSGVCIPSGHYAAFKNERIRGKKWYYADVLVDK